jgi:hypothetical protein
VHLFLDLPVMVWIRIPKTVCGCLGKWWNLKRKVFVGDLRSLQCAIKRD